MKKYKPRLLTAQQQIIRAILIILVMLISITVTDYLVYKKNFSKLPVVGIVSVVLGLSVLGLDYFLWIPKIKSIHHTKK